jgi:hypothetical protein
MAVSSKTTGAIGGAAQGAAAGSAFGPYGIAAGAIIGGIGGFLGGGGEDEAMKLAEKQANLIRQTSKENQRRMRLDLAQKMGWANAASYASNIQSTGSTRRYQRALESTGRTDMAWERERARLEAEIAMDMGQAAASQITSSSTASMIQGLTKAAGVFGPSIMQSFGAPDIQAKADAAMVTPGTKTNDYLKSIGVL